MITKLSKVENDLALVFDEQFLKSRGIDENTPLKIKIEGKCIIIIPMNEINERIKHSVISDDPKTQKGF